MARRKSQEQLRQQSLRLINEVGGNEERLNRVQQAFARYSRNIQRTPSYRRNLERRGALRAEANRAYANGDYDRSGELVMQSRDAGSAMVNRQYSRATYMGLNEG